MHPDTSSKWSSYIDARSTSNKDWHGTTIYGRPPRLKLEAEMFHTRVITQLFDICGKNSEKEIDT